MSLTRRYTAAMKRLAEYMGFRVESQPGGLWIMYPPDGKPYLPMKSERCMGSLISVATAPLSWKGLGLTYAEVAEICQLGVPSRRIPPTRWWTQEIIKMQVAIET